MIDQELRLLAVVRSAVCREGARLSTAVIDEVLDERLDAANTSRAVQHLTH